MKKKILILVLLIIAVGGGYYAYTQRQAALENGRLTLYGNVDIREVGLGFRVSGRIAEMRYEEGDEVKVGDVLSVLDKQPFQEQYDLAAANLREAEAAASNAEKLFKRRAKLIKTGAVSQDSYDEALAARDQAVARVATMKAKLEQAKTQLKDTEVRSPADGIILTRVHEPGAIVGVGAPVYSLALRNPVWVRTYIDEPKLGLIYSGQPARVLTDTGDEYVGHIGFISPQAEFTPKNVETAQLRTDLVYRLRVIVNEPDKRLRQGMPVTVKVELQQKAGGDER